jgi:hypothetical protein
MSAEPAKTEKSPGTDQKPIFLSHASKDKLLADRLVKLLTNGCDVSPNEILCTSLPGKGIPGGTPSFIEYLRGQLGHPKLVILLLSQNYFLSQFCLCELGATWRMQFPWFPLVVPPLAKEELGGVLEVVQAGSIVDQRYLDELREAVIRHLDCKVPTATWNVEAGVFLNGLQDLIAALEKPPMVSRAELENARLQIQTAVGEIASRDKQMEKLKAQILDLEKCKDREQVNAANQKHSTDPVQFEQLVAGAKETLGKLCRATKKAIFFEGRGDHYTWDGKDEWNEVQEAEQVEEVEIVNDYNRYCKPRAEHIRVGKAQDALRDLAEFLKDEAHFDFAAKLEDEHGFPMRLSNKEFWHEILSVYV